MIKDLLKELKGIMLDVIEEVDRSDAPLEIQQKRAAVIFDKYDGKIRNSEFDKKLTDTQREKLKKVYEGATKGLKEIIEEVEKGDCPVKAEEKETPKFKVGQRVRFKTWEEMEKEFGLDKDGDIDCSKCFTKNMKKLCGTYATIRAIDKEGRIELKNFSINHHDFFVYSIDMIKAVE